jgi:hypothetical protein
MISKQQGKEIIACVRGLETLANAYLPMLAAGMIHGGTRENLRQASSA